MSEPQKEPVRVEHIRVGNHWATYAVLPDDTWKDEQLKRQEALLRLYKETDA